MQDFDDFIIGPQSDERDTDMVKIYTAQAYLPACSAHRTEKRMSAEALIEAFKGGADFVAMSINGEPCQRYCSCMDFADGSTMEVFESDGNYMCSVTCFTYKPSIDPQEIETLL